MPEGFAPLVVWCFDRQAGALTQRANGMEFAYAAEWVADGMPPLSQSLPLDGRFDAAAAAFFGGLLPEGEPRRHLARPSPSGWMGVRACLHRRRHPPAYVEVLSDEKAITAVGFLRRAIKHFASCGITAERLITDNGSAYRSTVHAIACRTLAIRHLRTCPYQINGKAERFIRTMLGGWAYGAIYRDSSERNAALAGWLDFYNRRRPHGARSHKPPTARLHELNNLVGSYS